MAGMEQNEIADKLEVSRNTVSKWCTTESWKEQRAATHVTRPELVNKLLGTIDNLITTVNQSNDPNLIAGLADKLAKFSAVIEKLDKKANVVDAIEVFMAFNKWLQFNASYDPEITPELIKAINKYKGVHAVIKWPNDVLLNGRKMVGILTEMSAEFGHINYVVIGTGINVNVPPEIIPEEIRPLAVSLQDAAEEPVRRVDVLADYLKNIEELYELVLAQGFKPVFDEWRKYTNTLGQAVKVMAPDETYTGTAVDIDEEGLLVVRRDDGTLTKVIAGDVSIRPAAAKDGAYA